MGELPRLGLAVAATGPEPSMAGLALLAGLNSRRVAGAAFPGAGVPDEHGGRPPGHGPARAATSTPG